MTWNQPGFVVISDVTKSGVPLTHGFYLTEWEAESAMRSLRLPDDLVRNIRVTGAALLIYDVKKEMEADRG